MSPRDGTNAISTKRGLSTMPPRWSEAWGNPEIAESLGRIYAALPTRQADALAMRIEQRLTYREIARELSTTPKAVDHLLHRARKRVRALLAEAEN